MILRSEGMLRNVRAAAELMKSLSNLNRLSIVCCLANGELSVDELRRLLAMRQPTLSRHLAGLRESEIVATREDAKQIYYRLKDDRAVRLIAVLEQTSCHDGLRRDLRSRSNSSLLVTQREFRSTLASAHFSEVLRKKRRDC